MMRIANLHYRHGSNSPPFFENLSFELEAGKLHALHGRNGCGKSILMSLLSGNKPWKGVFEGEIVGVERAALVNQHFDLLIAHSFSFAENLAFAAMGRFPTPFSRLKSPSLDHYAALLDSFNIDPSLPVTQLSGGQRQILALLMVLQQKRDILLLDEPTAALDEDNSRLVFSFLEALASEKQTTCFIVCHDRELIDQYTSGRSLQLFIDPSSGIRRLSDRAGG